MSPAHDERARGTAGQELRLGRDQACGEQGENQHVGETQQRQVRLTQQGPQRLAKNRRERVVEPMQRPAKANQERSERARYRQPEQPAVSEPGNPALVSTPAAPRPQEEEGLPAERVEVSHLVRSWI